MHSPFVDGLPAHYGNFWIYIPYLILGDGVEVAVLYGHVGHLSLFNGADLLFLELGIGTSHGLDP